MSIVGAVVVFAVCWFLALYCLLPIGVRSIEEANDPSPEGAMSGAPANPNIRYKAAGATVISLGLTILFWFGVDWGIISLETIDRVMGWEG